MQKKKQRRRSGPNHLRQSISATLTENWSGLAALHEPENAAETLDTLFGGKLKLYQSRNGYRFSVDAVLLAYFASVGRAGKIADLGTGNAVIPLILAYLYPAASITGFELQQGMLDRARRNILLNGFAARVRIINGDVRSIEQSAQRGSFDAVTCNPPYRKSGGGRLSPDTEKKLARHELQGTLDDFIRAGAYLLAAKGRMALVYRAERTVELFQTMQRFDIEPKSLRCVHSFVGAEASLILVEGRKASRSGLSILPPLIVYEKPKTYTAELKRMLAGVRFQGPG
jgi:tRNA1Val (adenine37-N6)-methyltransferase